MPTIIGTKEQFIEIYEHLLKIEPGYGWAQDKERLQKFMSSVRTTIYTPNNTWNIDSPVVVKAWRGIGMKGKPSYKGLRALPEGEGVNTR